MEHSINKMEHRTRERRRSSEYQFPDSKISNTKFSNSKCSWPLNFIKSSIFLFAASTVSIVQSMTTAATSSSCPRGNYQLQSVIPMLQKTASQKYQIPGAYAFVPNSMTQYFMPYSRSGSNKIIEFKDAHAMFDSSSINFNKHQLRTRAEGSALVILNDRFAYYNAFSTPEVVKYDLKHREVVQKYELKNANYHGTSEYTVEHGTDIDLAYDAVNNVIYAIYASEENSGNIMIEKLDENTLQPISTYSTSFHKSLHGIENSFIICGVLYVIDDFGRIVGSFDTKAKAGSRERGVRTENPEFPEIKMRDEDDSQFISVNYYNGNIICWTVDGDFISYSIEFGKIESGNLMVTTVEETTTEVILETTPRPTVCAENERLRLPGGKSVNEFVRVKCGEDLGRKNEKRIGGSRFNTYYRKYMCSDELSWSKQEENCPGRDLDDLYFRLNQNLLRTIEHLHQTIKTTDLTTTDLHYITDVLISFFNIGSRNFDYKSINRKFSRMQREKILKTILQIGKQRNWLSDNHDSFWIQRYFHLLKSISSSNFCDAGYSSVDELNYFSAESGVFAAITPEYYQDMPALLVAKRFGVKNDYSNGVLDKYLPVNEFYLKLACFSNRNIQEESRSRFEQSLCNPLSISSSDCLEKCSSCNTGDSLDIFVVSPIIIKPILPQEKATTIKVLSTPISEKIDEENTRITYLTTTIYVVASLDMLISVIAVAYSSSIIACFPNILNLAIFIMSIVKVALVDNASSSYLLIPFSGLIITRLLSEFIQQRESKSNPATTYSMITGLTVFGLGFCSVTLIISYFLDSESDTFSEMSIISVAIFQYITTGVCGFILLLSTVFMLKYVGSNALKSIPVSVGMIVLNYCASFDFMDATSLSLLLGTLVWLVIAQTCLMSCNNMQKIDKNSDSFSQREFITGSVTTDEISKHTESMDFLTAKKLQSSPGGMDPGYVSQTCSHEHTSGSLSSRDSFNLNQQNNSHSGLVGQGHDARDEFSFTRGTLGGATCQCAKAGISHHNYSQTGVNQGNSTSFATFAAHHNSCLSYGSPSSTPQGRRQLQTLQPGRGRRDRDFLERDGAPKLSVSNGEVLLVHEVSCPM